MVVTDTHVVMGSESTPPGVRDTDAQLDGARLLDDIGRLLDYAAALLPQGGTVIVTRPPGGWSESPYIAPAVRDLDAMVIDAQAAGWNTHAGRGHETGWYTFRNRDPRQPQLHVGIRPMLNQTRTPLWTVGEATAQDIAHQLARWHALTGTAYRQTPGVTGCAMIRDHYADRGSNGFKRAEPLWRLPEIPDTVSTAGGELRWHRPPTDGELALPYVVSFDMRAARANAMGMVDTLAFSKLAHVGHATQFNRKAGGYWKVAAGEILSAYGLAAWDSPRALPVISEVCADDGGYVWLTTPMMRWLDNRGALPLIHDAWISDAAGQYLRYFRDSIRHALHAADGDDTMTRAVKQCYQQTSGMLAAVGGSIDRRDWNNTILDHERGSVLTAAERVWQQTGCWPMRVNVDELVYAVNGDADARAISHLLGSGPELGKWKGKLWRTPAGEWLPLLPMADYRERYGH